LFQNDPVLGFGATTVLGGAAFQRDDNFLRNISHQ
jgi:hypothetical protein